MEIKLTPQESEKYFHNALCNGMSEIGYSGLKFSYEGADYQKAKKSLQEKIDKKEYPHEMYVFKGETPSICREDVWMEILRNGDKLEIVDIEGDGTYTRSIGLAEVHERVQKTESSHLQDMISENDDASTAFEVLQMVFFEESIFG